MFAARRPRQQRVNNHLSETGAAVEGGKSKSGGREIKERREMCGFVSKSCSVVFGFPRCVRKWLLRLINLSHAPTLSTTGWYILSSSSFHLSYSSSLSLQPLSLIFIPYVSSHSLSFASGLLIRLFLFLPNPSLPVSSYLFLIPLFLFLPQPSLSISYQSLSSYFFLITLFLFLPPPVSLHLSPLGLLLRLSPPLCNFLLPLSSSTLAPPLYSSSCFFICILISSLPPFLPLIFRAGKNLRFFRKK